MSEFICHIKLDGLATKYESLNFQILQGLVSPGW